jgi:putative zinc finger protein
VTHEDLRARLPQYAAGELAGDDADVVRRHLATGCVECLEDVFRRPVGQPLARTPSEPAVRVERRNPRPRGGRRLLTGAVVVLALALAALAGWTITELRQREIAARDDAARLTARLSDEASKGAVLAERVTSLERERDAAREEASRQVAAVRETAEASAQAREALEAAQSRIETLERGMHRRDVELDRLHARSEAERTLGELVATPGLQILPLVGVGPFESVRGHVLWHPDRHGLVLYAFDLPALADGASYEVRLRLDGGRVEHGPTFRPGARGDAAVAVSLDGEVGRLREVDVLRQPSAVPVLAARVPSTAG